MAAVRGIGVAVITSTSGTAPPPALSRKRGALLDTEAVLLVDDHDTQAAELDGLLDERVRADQQVDLPGGERGEHALALLAGDLVREQLDRERSLAEQRRAVVGHRDALEQRPDRREVLIGQHLGGRHERALVAALHRGQQRRHGDDRLARADVALQEPMHRDGAGEVGRDLRDHASAGHR